MNGNLNDIKHLAYLGVMTLMLVTDCAFAAPAPNTPRCEPTRQILHDQVGLCNKNGSFYIWDCTPCHIGNGYSVECGRIYNVGTKLECVPCKKGYYSDTHDIGQCKLCRKCQQNEYQTGHCLKRKDSIKCFCKKGFYRDDFSKDCKPCSWCCDDGSNKNMTECNDKDIPPRKQCSFQDYQVCDPTVAPSISTTIDSFQKTLFSTFKPLTTEKPRQKVPTVTNNSSLNNNDLVNLSKLGKNTMGDAGTDWTISVVIPVVIVVPLSTLIIALLIYICRRNPSSNSNASSSGRQSLETSTSLLNGEQVKSNKNPGDEETESVDLHPHEGTAEFHVQKVPLLPTPGNCIGASRGSTSEPTSMVCTSTESQHSMDVSHSMSLVPNPLTYEQKFQLPVTKIPEDIYTYICEELDDEEPFFRDKRILYEKLNNTKLTANTSTNTILTNHKVTVQKFLEILSHSDMDRKDLTERIERWLYQS